uniref:oxaloacetate tautomerase n=1 Tax=Romanomermis culicivorax TaxID=13658 RepID=A0A915J9C4_ROMCU
MLEKFTFMGEARLQIRYDFVNKSILNEQRKHLTCNIKRCLHRSPELLKNLPLEPLLFVKPTSSFIGEGQKIKVPRGCSDLKQEVELGVVIGDRYDQNAKGRALNYVAGYVLALDMTADDLLAKARQLGNPWFLAKGFDGSCPVSDFIPKECITDPQNITLWCKVNGVLKQNEKTSSMIFDIEQLMKYASNFVTLEAGDVLLTGTPPGMCSVKPGDIIECGLGEIMKMKFVVE